MKKGSFCKTCPNPEPFFCTSLLVFFLLLFIFRRCLVREDPYIQGSALQSGFLEMCNDPSWLNLWSRKFARHLLVSSPILLLPLLVLSHCTVLSSSSSFSSFLLPSSFFFSFFFLSSSSFFSSFFFFFLPRSPSFFLLHSFFLSSTPPFLKTKKVFWLLPDQG